MPEQARLSERSSFGRGSLFYFLPAVGILILLTVASCTSNDEFNAIYKQAAQSLSFGDSSLSSWLIAHPGVGHILGYAVLSLALSGIFSHQRLFIAPLIAVIFGVLMEGVQVFIPTRGASLIDMGSNILGVAIGFIVYLLWRASIRGVGLNSV